MDDRATARRGGWPAPGRWRLATRLTAAMLALLLLLQALGLAAALRQAQERRAAEVANAEALARTLAALVDTVARDLEGATLAVALALGAGERPVDQAAVGPSLRALVAEYGLLRALFVTDPRGRVVATSATGVGVDLGDRPYIRALQAGAESVWSGGLTGVQSGEVTVAFGRVVRATDGTPRAYLVAAFYPERLVGLLPAGLPPDGAIALLDERGAVLYASDRPDLAPEQRDAAAAPGVAAALAGAVVPVEAAATPFAGEARYGALAPVARTGWVVAFTRPQAALEDALRRQLAAQAGVLAAALLGAAAVVALLARRLARPLAELAGAAAAVARGERPAVAASGADPDVAALAEAMRRMSAAVAEREDAQRLLAEAGAALAGSLDEALTLDAVAHLAVPRLADWCVAYLADDEGRVRRAAVAGPDVAASSVREAYGSGEVELAPADPVARALRTGLPVLIEAMTAGALEAAARDVAHLDALRALDVRSQLVAPLAAGGRTLGALSLMTGSGRRLGPKERALAAELADRAALALVNARLYGEARAALAQRDGFLAGVSHDLKNPLASVKALAQLLQRRAARLDDPAAARLVEGLRTIDAVATRATAMVDELLDLTRLQAGQALALERRPTDLAALARRAAAEQQPTTDRHAIRVEAIADGLVGRWDGDRLARVIGNLVGNSIKYSPDGGPIRIRVERAEDAAGAWAVLTVADEGVGIPTGELPRVFERFYRGSNVAGRTRGSGLGLAGAREIVAQHGGDLTLTSAEERGTTATVRLPLAGPVGDNGGDEA